MKQADDQGTHGMAEMAGGVLEAQHDAVLEASTGGLDAAGVVAAEMSGEGQWVPADPSAAVDEVPAGLAALEAETEE